MTGDQDDILARLRAVLPARWFPDVTPVLDSLLTGLSSAWAMIYGLILDVRAQARIATATGVLLDIIAQDFFGQDITRNPGQGDDSFRRRIQLEIFRERGTRLGISSALEDLTGRSPAIFEPACTSDTGGYGTLTANSVGLGYCAAGGWGSLRLPFQCFVTAFRPVNSGIALVNGWCEPAGGYGAGAMEYGNLDMIEGQVTDADIFNAAAKVLPVASTAWVQITS